MCATGRSLPLPPIYPSVVLPRPHKKKRVPAHFAVHSSRHPPATTSSPDKRKLAHGVNEPRGPRVGAAGCEVRVGKGGGEFEGEGENSSIAVDGTVDWKTVEGSGVHRAVGIEDGSSGDGRANDDDSSDARPQASAFSGVREDKEAASAAAESGGWCSVDPENGTLLPGEKLELRFTALVRCAILRIEARLSTAINSWESYPASSSNICFALKQ